ncbi:hypothetical protein [Nocardioides sp.]|uniref:hypothetical protein n=1 Tax=Nocardioides sp. TaxID=35761 RepID=UPI0035127A78
MRSHRGGCADQGVLPFDVAPDPAAAPLPRRRPASRALPEAERQVRRRLRSDAFGSRGWPAGTELLIDLDRTPREGELALARDRGRLQIGVLERRLGRWALLSDHGTTWLSNAARYVGTVIEISPPLAGMPSDPPADPA